MAVERTLSQAELKKLRSKISSFYAILSEVARQAGSDKLTIGELVERRWQIAKDKYKGNPSIMEMIEPYIASDLGFATAVHGFAIESGERTSRDLALNSTLEMLEFAMGKISLYIAPENYTYYECALEAATEDSNNSDEYEINATKYLEDKFDQEADMYDVYARKYLTHLFYYGKIEKKDYDEQIKALETNVGAMGQYREALEKSALKTLKQFKREERGEKFKSIFSVFKKSMDDEKEDE